jgi:hypothetical protein
MLKTYFEDGVLVVAACDRFMVSFHVGEDAAQVAEGFPAGKSGDEVGTFWRVGMFGVVVLIEWRVAAACREAAMLAMHARVLSENA